MLKLFRNSVNWENFRKGAVLVLVLLATATAVLFGILYFLGAGRRSPAPPNLFRAVVLLSRALIVARVPLPAGETDIQ
jgi:hypothetical protein